MITRLIRTYEFNLRKTELRERLDEYARSKVLKYYADCLHCVHRLDDEKEPCEFIGTESRLPNCKRFNLALEVYLNSN